MLRHSPRHFHGRDDKAPEFLAEAVNGASTEALRPDVGLTCNLLHLEFMGSITLAPPRYRDNSRARRKTACMSNSTNARSYASMN
jgi:hypothetical protein